MNLTTRIAKIKEALAAKDDPLMVACFKGMYEDEIRLTLDYLIREQDKKTRHACAEAVAALAETKELRLFVDLQRAHQACMNVQAL